MFSRSSLVDVHLVYKIKNVVSKCSGVPSSVLANTLHGLQKRERWREKRRRKRGGGYLFLILSLTFSFLMRNVGVPSPFNAVHPG